MDALDMLRLEAETIWGQGLGSDTLFVTATTYDGRTEILAGHADATPGTPTTVSAARCWILPPQPRLPPSPAGLSLVLLSDEGGPCAALTDGDQVVSRAHCARLTSRAAEVGVQTEDAYQGRGLAAVAVHAWATFLAPSGKVLFYSALEDNTASHRVAAKCGATPLGILCRLGISA